MELEEAGGSCSFEDVTVTLLGGITAGEATEEATTGTG